MHPFLENYFKFIKRIMPSGGQATVVGLDMGQLAFKAVEIARRADGFEMVRCQVEPLTGGNERDALLKIIAGFDLAKNPRPVFSGISGRGTLIRYIDMPRMALRDLHKALAIDSDRYLPFPKNTVSIDSFILDPEGRDKKMSVLIAAVKKELIEARMKFFEECALAVDGVTVSPVALANAFGAVPPSLDKSDKMTAVVDIADGVSNLMIIGGKMPRFNRDIFIGVQEILRRLENLSGIPVSDGRALLHSPGDKADLVRQAVDAIVANLVAEIRLSFDYFITEKNIQIGQIVLVGEGASVVGVRKVFEDNFEIPLVVWDPLEKISLGGTLDKTVVAGMGVRLVTALGLAMSAYD